MFLYKPTEILKNDDKIHHVWTITHFDNLFKDDTPKVIFSDLFPLNFSFLQCSLRLVANYSEGEVALFLVIKKFDYSSNDGKLNVDFEVQIKSCEKELGLKKKTIKTFLQTKNSQGFENLIDRETLQNLMINNTITVVCTINLQPYNFKTPIPNIYSFSTTQVLNFKKIRKFIKIKNFTKSFFKDPFVESKKYLLEKNSNVKFSVLIFKEKNEKNEETGFASFFIKFLSNESTITDLKWHFSIWSWYKKSFITSGKIFLNYFPMN